MKLPKAEIICLTVTNSKSKEYVITRTLDENYVLYEKIDSSNYTKISKKDSPTKLEKLIPDYNSGGKK